MPSKLDTKDTETAIEKTAIEKLEEAIAEERDSIGDRYERYGINRHTACKEKVDEALAELEAELDELHDIIDSYDDPGPDPDYIRF